MQINCYSIRCTLIDAPTTNIDFFKIRQFIYLLKRLFVLQKNLSTGSFSRATDLSDIVKNERIDQLFKDAGT